MSIDRLVAQALAEAGADESTRQLWSEMLKAFDEGGPNEVKQLIQTKVRESKRRAEKEAKSVRSIAATVAKPKRAAIRRRG
jgi:hypothetical protein